MTVNPMISGGIRLDLSPTERICALLVCAAEKHLLKKAVFSKPQDPSLLRSVVTLKQLGGKEVLQAELFLTDHKAIHRNFEGINTETLLDFAASYGFGQINLLTTVGDCECKKSKSGKETLIGGNVLERAMGQEVSETTILAPKGNNREKNYILSGNEPFLKRLGVSDERGRVHDKKQPKFRQINRFLEMVRDIEEKLPQTGELRIADLCCGKSYLSFAVYHYFSNIRGRAVRMTGMDLKPDVIAFCNSVASDLHFDGLEFLCGDIGAYQIPEQVHLVVSLHACDTATDLVLGKAIDWNADVILSTPCCHHELNHTLNCPELSFLAKHSMLRQKFCDAATDALRLKLLESKGYSVAALELIDPEETPKNILLRAIRKKNFDRNGAEAQRLSKEYEAVKNFLIGGSSDVPKIISQ